MQCSRMLYALHSATYDKYCIRYDKVKHDDIIYIIHIIYSIYYSHRTALTSLYSRPPPCDRRY